MKKRLFFIIFMTLFCSTMFGQKPNWEAPNSGSFQGNMTVSAYFKIYGEEQFNENIEFAAFCGDELRGVGSKPVKVTLNGEEHYLSVMPVHGNTNETIKFKIWDPVLEEVLGTLTEKDFYINDVFGPIAMDFYQEYWDFTRDVNKVPESMTIISQVAIDGNPIIRKNLEVAAFHGEELRGIGRYDEIDNNMIYFTIYGDSKETENITFQLYDHEYGTLIAESNYSKPFVNEGVYGTYYKPEIINFIIDSYVAQIGENKYLSFDAALEAAKDGDNIELLKSIDLGTTTAVISKSVNITLGSFSITGTVELAHTSATITGKAEGMTVVSGVENYLVNFDENTNVYSLVERSVSGKVAYRAYINDVADREAVQVDLTNVYAKTSFVVELLDAKGNVLTTTSLNAGAVNAETYTCNIVLDGTASSSWTTEKKAQKLTVANIPQTIKVYADRTLVDTYVNALGAGTGVDETAKYKALDCVYKEASITRNGTTEYYATLESAYEASVSDDEIDILDNITLTETLTIEKAITLDLNSKTVAGVNESVVFNVKSAIAIKNGTVTGQITLAILESTVEGPEGMNVTTNVEGYKVVYEDGMYKLVAKSYVAKVGDVKYETLDEALAAAQSGATITMLVPIVVAAGETLEIDLIGRTIEYTSSVVGEDMITNNGTLTINDTKGGGKITYKNTDTTGSNVTVNTISNGPGGLLTVNGGTIENTTSADKATTGQIMPFAIDNLTNGTFGTAKTTINGGTVKSNYRSIRLFANSTSDMNTVEITGGEMKGQVWLQAPNSNENKVTLTISGGTFAPEGNDASSVFVTTMNVTAPIFNVTDGYFTTKIGTDNTSLACNEGIAGGKFTAEAKENTPEGLVKSGYVFAENQDGTYGVIPGTYVYSYDELVEAIQDNASTIFIGADIDIEEPTTIPENVNVIVKDGFTLNVLNTLTNNGTIKGDGNVNVRVMVYVVETVEPYEGVSYDVRATKNGAIGGTVPENSVQYQISLDGGQTWFEDTTNGKAQAVTVKTDGTTVVNSSFQSAYTSAKTGETVHMLTDAHVQSTNPKKNNGPLRSYYGLILEGNGHTIFTDLESSGASNEYATIKFTSYLAGTGPEVNPILKNVTVDSQKNAKADLDYVSGDVTFTVTMYNVNLLGNCQYSNFAMKSPSMIVNNSNVEIYDSNIPSWDAGSANAINIYSGEYSLTLNNKCTVYGGTYTKDVTAYLADGLILIQNEEGKYVVDGYYEAKIGTTGYETLEAAVAAATDGCTIDLLADVEISNTLSFSFNSAFDKINVTFNGNGKTIKAVGSDWDDNKWLADIAWNVTLNDVTFDGNNTGCKGVQFYTSTSTLNNVTVKNVSANKWNSTDYAIHANASELTVKGNLTFEGCKHGMLMVDLGSNTGKEASVVSVAEDAKVTDVTVILNHKDASMNAPASAASYVSVGNVPGYTMVYENGSFKLVEAVAQIEGILYATLEAAFVAAEEGQTVTLLKDITLSEALTIEEAITLNLNNKTVTGANDAIVFNVEAAIKIEYGTIDIQINLTVVGSTVEGPEGLNVVSGVDGYMVIYENNTYKLVKIEGQSIVFGERWNWFSHYVVGDTDSDILNKLKNGLGEHGVQIKNQNQFIDYGTNQEGDSGWWGDLKSTSVKEMYKVNTSLENPNTITVVFEGAIVNPESYPITLNANWNYIGYPLTESVSVKAAFAFVAKDGDYVKSQDAFAEYYNGNWHGNLKTMTPGEGYMYRNVLVEGVNDVTKTLTYSYPRTSEIAEANITAENNHWVPASSQYADNMTMIAMLDVKGEDYEVAAFVNGEVHGSARATYIESLDAYMFFMTIHGEGVEEMTFKCYDLATGEDYLLDNRMNYSSDAVVGSVREPYMLTCSTLGIGENAASVISIYPNPATTGNEINLAATCDTVEVFNALGVKIAEYQNVDTIDAIETAGVYMIRVTNNGNVQNCRLVVK